MMSYPVKPPHSAHSSNKVSGSLNSTRKGKLEGMTSKQMMSAHPHTVAVRQSDRNTPSPVNSLLTGGMGMNPTGGMGMSSSPAGILVKQNLVNSDVVSNYPTPPVSHYMHHYGGVAMMGGAKQDIKGMYESLSKSDGGKLYM